MPGSKPFPTGVFRWDASPPHRGATNTLDCHGRRNRACWDHAAGHSKIHGVGFRVSALLCIPGNSRSLVRWLDGLGYDFFQLRGLLLAYFPVLALINAMAWWSIWKDKSWARGWAIAASLICTELPVRRIISFHRSPWGDLGGLVLIGVACLIAFLWPYPMRPTAITPKPPKPEEKTA